MKRFGNSLVLASVLLAIAVWGISAALFNSTPSEPGANMAAGFFFLLVFGLPALGLVFLGLTISMLSYAFHVLFKVSKDGKQDGVRPTNNYGWPAKLCFGLAIVWGASAAISALVHVEGGPMLILTALTALLPATCLFCIGVAFAAFHRRNNDRRAQQ